MTKQSEFNGSNGTDKQLLIPEIKFFDKQFKLFALWFSILLILILLILSILFESSPLNQNGRCEVGFYLDGFRAQTRMFCR